MSDLDVTGQATAITSRDDVGPLASAIAQIVRDGRASKKALMLGAVFGAYAYAFPAHGDTASAVDGAILGAVAGGSALAANEVLHASFERRAWAGYTSDQA